MNDWSSVNGRGHCINEVPSSNELPVVFVNSCFLHLLHPTFTVSLLLQWTKCTNRFHTSHVLQRKIEAQQVIQFPGNIKTSYSTCRIYPSSGPKSGSNVPSSAWSKSSSSSSALSKSSSSSSSPPTPLLY